MRTRMIRRVDTTRIVWNHAYEVHECEKCHNIMHYNFGFKYCPYCRRKVVQNEERATKTG